MFKKISNFGRQALIKDFIIYACGAVFLRSITVIMMPLYAYVLAPQDFGKLSLMHSAIRIAIALCGFGLPQALSVEYFHCTQQQRKQLVNDILLLYVMASFLLFIFGFSFYPQICSFFCLDTIPGYLLGISCVIVYISFFVELLYQIMQYERIALPLTRLQSVSACITTLSTIWLLWGGGYGFASIVYGQCLGLCCSLVVGSHLYIKKKYHEQIVFSRSMSKYIYLLMRGLPFIPAVLSGWLLAAGDRWVLAHYSTLHNVGIYSIANLSAQAFQFLVLYPWGAAYLPYILRQYAENKDQIYVIERHHKRVMWLSMLVASGVITVLIGITICLARLFCFNRLIMYQDLFYYCWFLLMGQVFVLGAYFASSLIQFHKKSFFLGLVLFGPALLNMGLNMLLIPRFVIYGCVLATLLSYIVYFLLTLWYSYYLQKKI